MDVFLAENINYLTRSFLKKLIENKQVKLNNFVQTSPSTKIKSFSHGEFNNEKINVEEIEKKINENQDLFDRGFKLKKVEIDSSYPNFIVNNKAKFSKWII